MKKSWDNDLFGNPLSGGWFEYSIYIICGFDSVQVSESYVAGGINVDCGVIVCPRTRRVRSGSAV